MGRQRWSFKMHVDASIPALITWVEGYFLVISFLFVYVYENSCRFAYRRVAPVPGEGSKCTIHIVPTEYY